LPHTHGRYMQDLGFVDAMISFGANDIEAYSITGTVALTRSAAGNLFWNVAASSTAFFEVGLLSEQVRRSGFAEDLQNVFGSTFGGGLGGPVAGPGGPGSGIPASAEPQGRPGSSSLQDGYILPGSPQPASSMGTLQEITPRTGLKIKGIKPLSITVIYQVTTGAMTTLTMQLNQVIYKNGVALAITNLLASGANGLINVAAATPYVTVVPIPNAVYYQITPLTQLWLEFNLSAPVSNSFQLYGVEMNCEFNFN
jgi:hypothetical protein